MNLKWNVFRYDINKREIITYDIFQHGGFTNYVRKHLAEIEDKDEFAKQLDLELRYYFWSKAEHEIIISGWPPSSDHSEDRKVDIYTQVKNNWDVFLEYVWSGRRNK